MKKNNEIRESIVSSANNILGDDILDHKLRREKLVVLPLRHFVINLTC